MKYKKLQSKNVQQMNMKNQRLKSATTENKSQPELRDAEVNDSCHVCSKLLDCLFQCLLIESALPLELSIPPQRCLLRRPLIR